MAKLYRWDNVHGGADRTPIFAEVFEPDQLIREDLFTVAEEPTDGSHVATGEHTGVRAVRERIDNVLSERLPGVGFDPQPIDMVFLRCVLPLYQMAGSGAITVPRVPGAGEDAVAFTILPFEELDERAGFVDIPGQAVFDNDDLIAFCREAGAYFIFYRPGH